METENFLKNKTKYDLQKSQEKLLIILIELINCFSKEIEILNKNIIEHKNQEKEKQFDLNNYTDFNESSPGMMFMEMAAYVGDVLSFYADTNLKESILLILFGSDVCSGSKMCKS